MHNKHVTLPASSTSASGIYEAQVIESPSLPGLRRKAFSKAGLIGNYDGSVSAYHALDGYAKEAHDKALSGLVSRNIRKIEGQRRMAAVVSSTGELPNLILDQGLNKILRASGTITWASWSVFCVAGTGTTATVTDSGVITATTAGSSTTITATSSIFTAAHVGGLIKFDSGAERYIQSQTGTACVVTVAVNIAAPTLFAVWAVNQLGLASESKRTNTYLTGTGNCGSSFASNVWSGKRTYDFSAEVANTNYTELGWSDIFTAGANLNSRTLITGGTVSVLIGQQLRVIYTLQVTVTPAVSTAGSYAITGWPVSPAVTVNGNYIIANPAGSIDPSISTAGGVNSNGAFPMSRTSLTIFHLCTGSALPTFGTNYSSGTQAVSDTTSYTSYTDNNFYLDAEGIFGLSTGNGTNWRGITAQGNPAFVFVFNEAQTKASTHTLTVRARMTIGRTLTNP